MKHFGVAMALLFWLASGHSRLEAQDALVLPIYFEANVGQTEQPVQFLARMNRHTAFFTPEGVVMALEGEGKRHVISLEFEHSQVPTLYGQNQQGHSSYFTATHTHIAPHYERVVYKDLYPGIEAVFYGNSGRLQYDFVLQPGVSHRSIRLKFTGATAVTLENEQLVLSVGEERIAFLPPYSYQDIEGTRVLVESAFTIEEGIVSFDVGLTHPDYPLIIDPVLFYAGFVGGGGWETAHDVYSDQDGNAYLVGYTESTQATFPETVGPDLTHNGGTHDIFIAKINPSGTGLVYAGYIGGSSDEVANGVAVDSAGNAYLVGHTASIDIPRVGTLDSTHNGNLDVYVAKVNPSGTGLVYAGYIGGSSDEKGYELALDSAGSLVVTGWTASSQATFPETVGPDLTHNGGRDCFVAKVNATGSGLDFAGYVGGSGDEECRGVAVDSAGHVYLGGFTSSTEATFPVLGGPDLTYNGGSTDGFVAKVNASGTALSYAGYIGGAASDYVMNNVEVNLSGALFVGGYTQSTESTFPVLGGPDLTYNGGTTDGFVAKVDPTGREWGIED